MSVKWLVFIVIILGFIAIGLNERDSDFSFSLGGPSRSFTPSASERSSSEREREEIITQTRTNEEVLEDIEDELEDIQDNINDLTTSVHASYVRLSASRARERNVDEEYITIEILRDAPSTLDLTGWRITGNAKDITVTLGSVARIPLHDTRQRAITPQPRDKIFVVSEQSPVKNSFQTNLCTGYLGEQRSFTPSLPRECPEPFDEARLESIGIDLEEVEEDIDDRRTNGDTICYRFLDRLRTCEDPRDTPDPETISHRCFDYIRDIGYDTCVDAHQRDSNFFGTEWYVYAGARFNDLWDDDDDTITLFDVEGKVVDTVSY